ncbi:hypothetical protein MJI12_27050, partial [Salmonella enterica subsp. enterica serovar Kentucky]|nr:hypothetical protein [Salmonella enterica subsp. enterica serovar Kentucky]
NRAFYVIFLRHQVGSPSSLIEYVSIASPRWMLKMRLLCGLFNSRQRGWILAIKLICWSC